MGGRRRRSRRRGGEWSGPELVCCEEGVLGQRTIRGRTRRVRLGPPGIARELRLRSAMPCGSVMPATRHRCSPISRITEGTHHLHFRVHTEVKSMHLRR